MHKASFILLIIGGLNWLIFGLFQTELGSWIGGMDSIIARIIYLVVGLAAVYEIVTHKNRCKNCDVTKIGGQM